MVLTFVAAVNVRRAECDVASRATTVDRRLQVRGLVRWTALSHGDSRGPHDCGR